MENTVFLESGERFELADDTEIACGDHLTTFKWGDLDPVQREAFLAGIDTDAGLACLFLPSGDAPDRS